ncbi:unnamed protein product [Chironomus riparius]|uniref:DUF243 domain-containing protein n=1 Tax=Chironomus riparius TaxID=315576 RepID=A0A9N9S1G9_9DIPT|nr:unnamed protein product [Chironomus riparius]
MQYITTSALGVQYVIFLVSLLKVLKVARCEPPPSTFYNRPNPQPFAPTIPPDTYGPPSQNFAPPIQNYGTLNTGFISSTPSKNYGAPSQPPSNSYGPPAQNPSNSYGPPAQNPSNSYGPPTLQSEYGPPSADTTPSPVIHKHVYIHIPPPEPDYSNPEYPIKNPVQPVQKHYRIIFIKAPTQASPTIPPLPPIQASSEEKTIVYVLVKKPDDLPEIIMPTPGTTKPTKPEVYFIRYKTEDKSTSTPEIETGGGYYRKK